MTVLSAPAPETVPRRRTNPSASVVSRSSRPRPLDKILPRAVLNELGGLARSRSCLSSGFVEQVHRRLNLAEKYGVSRRRLGNFLKRAQQARTKADIPGTSPGEEAEGEGYGERLRVHRKRQVSVAEILDATFGDLTKCSPDLWDRRAYLMLVGLVYERLAASEKEIPTAELVAVAKVLAESRRGELRSVGRSRSEDGDEGKDRPSGRLPPRFADVVREVYGMNLENLGEATAGKSAASAKDVGSDGVGG